jgi:hypothetical protein
MLQLPSGPVRVARTFTSRTRRRVRRAMVLGVLGTGERDILGLWFRDETAWAPILSNMRQRGVERIRFAVSADPLLLCDRDAHNSSAPVLVHVLGDAQWHDVPTLSVRKAVVSAADANDR